MTGLNNICEVCHRQVGWLIVHSSAVGPLSFASCEECCEHHAEMEFTFHYLYDYVGSKGEGLVDPMPYCTTWKDGRYMTWQEWVAWRRDPERVAQLDAAADAQFERMSAEMAYHDQH